MEIIRESCTSVERSPDRGSIEGEDGENMPFIFTCCPFSIVRYATETLNNDAMKRLYNFHGKIMYVFNSFNSVIFILFVCSLSSVVHRESKKCVKPEISKVYPLSFLFIVSVLYEITIYDFIEICSTKLKRYCIFLNRRNSRFSEQRWRGWNRSGII